MQEINKHTTQTCGEAQELVINAANEIERHIIATAVRQPKLESLIANQSPTAPGLPDGYAMK